MQSIKTEFMKTLVIHPIDHSTRFLSEIYADKGWTVINHNSSEKELVEQIKAHDRIVMLGHGTPTGLLGHGGFVINSKHVYLLREKICFCIWCNSDQFVEKYGLKGFYTGMIISEQSEAWMEGIDISDEDLLYSNELLPKIVKEAINHKDIAKKVKEAYNSNVNPVIMFNHERIYQTNS